MSIRIGRLELNEADARLFDEVWSMSNGTEPSRTVSLTGTEWAPQRDFDRLTGVHDDILNLGGDRFQPVTFGMKDHRDGFYQVVSSEALLTQVDSEQIIILGWKIDLVRGGAANEIDFESRLQEPLRLNDHAIAGERWHAPPIGHRAYYTDNGQPSEMVRESLDGQITVYRGLAVGVYPRWNCLPGDYVKGRVRLIDADAGERCGTDFRLQTTGWIFHNGVVGVRPGTGHTLDVLTWDGDTDWWAQDFDVKAGATALANPISAVVLTNTLERMTLRLTYDQTPSGRYTIDLTIRRGSRVVELTIKSAYSADLSVVRGTAEAGTDGSGFVSATANDVNGNRYLIGSPKTFTSDLIAGGISLTAASRMWAFIGSVVGGDTAIDGDEAADLVNQYMASLTEEVVGVNL